MTARQYRETLARLGLSQARLARLLDLDKGTPNRWAMGSVAVPRAVAMLLGALERKWLTLEQLEGL